MTAILTTLLLALPASNFTTTDSSPPTPKTRTHNLHSEILLNLWTNNIISEAIKKFGISDKTKDLIVVRFGDAQPKQVWEAMEAVVDGKLGEVAELDKEGVADWKVLDKVGFDFARFLAQSQAGSAGLMFPHST